MIFNSYIFILFFLPITLVGYYLLGAYKKHDLTKLWLIFSSVCFYGYLQWKSLCVLLAGSLCTYYIVVIMKKVKQYRYKRYVMCIGIIVNIAYLFCFKYFNFFIDNVNHIFKTDYIFIQWIVPVGIGFITLQQISFLVDCYKDNEISNTILDYFVYITFFPKLGSGPIITYKEFIPQLSVINRRNVCYENLSKGLALFTFGLSKKVLIADTFSLCVEKGYADIASLSTFSTIVVMLSYAMQLYFDFSGYSDMARGVGQMLNFSLPVNFESPYKAVSVSDLWNRWHISLNRFFIEYVYFPLGGSRRGSLRTYFNVLFVFLLSGLWHGASWTYVAWGMMNGIMLIIERLTKRRIEKIPILGRITTFLFFTFSIVIFRSKSLSEAVHFLSKLFVKGSSVVEAGPLTAINELVEVSILYRLGLKNIITVFPWVPIVVLLAVFLFICFFTRNTQDRMKQFKFNKVNTFVIVILLVWGIVSLSNVSSFIYAVF